MNYTRLCVNIFNGVSPYSGEIHLHGMGFILILTCYEVKSFSLDILMVEFISIMGMTNFPMHVAFQCEACSMDNISRTHSW